MRLDSWTGERLVLGVLALVVSTLVSSAVVVAFVVRIPAGYFLASGSAPMKTFASPWLRAAHLVGKNLLGLVLLCAGAVLALPGVPGQGLLTMLVGLVLMDVPGKRRVELAVVRRAPVLRAINAIRARFDQPPLLVDGR